VDTMFSGDLTKVAITVADVDKFYWDLVNCLQLNVIMLMQNLV